MQSPAEDSRNDGDGGESRPISDVAHNGLGVVAADCAMVNWRAEHSTARKEALRGVLCKIVERLQAGGGVAVELEAIADRVRSALEAEAARPRDDRTPLQSRLIPFAALRYLIDVLLHVVRVTDGNGREIACAAFVASCSARAPSRAPPPHRLATFDEVDRHETLLRGPLSQVDSARKRYEPLSERWLRKFTREVHRSAALASDGVAFVDAVPAILLARAACRCLEHGLTHMLSSAESLAPLNADALDAERPAFKRPRTLVLPFGGYSTTT